MRTNDEIQELINHFQFIDDIVVDEAGVRAEYQGNTLEQPLAIKILSVFGGIMASVFFLVFLGLSGLFQYYWILLLLGVTAMIAAVWWTRKYDLIMLDSFSVCIFIIGLSLMGLSLQELLKSESLMYLSGIFASLATLTFSRNYLISFLSVLAIYGGHVGLILHNGFHDLLPIQAMFLSALTLFVFMREPYIVTANETISRLYNSVRMGLVFCLLMSLNMVTLEEFDFDIKSNGWACSIFNISAMVFLIWRLMVLLEVNENSKRILLLTAVVLILLPTIPSPAISGTLLLVLLGFHYDHKTTLVVGIVGFIYSISQYYYDLNFTLLTKSILLFTSGVGFLALYFITQKIYLSHGKD